MPNQDLRLRRKVVTTGERPANNRLPLILTLAAVAVIAPVLIYTALHPANVSTTVKQIARHFALPTKDIRIAVVAARSTPEPSPTAAASTAPSPTARPVATTAAEAAAALHQAHLHRLHELALRAARKRHSAVANADLNAGYSAADLGTQSPVNTRPADTNQSSSANTEQANVQPMASPTASPVQVAAAAPPQVPIAEPTAVYAPEIIVDARFTKQVRPDYPEVAREEGAQGTAVVLAVIGPSGNVLSARIDQSTGNKLLDGAALSAARNSGFEPPRINGKPATETYRLLYTFSI